MHQGQPIKPFQSYVRPPKPRKRGPILFWFTLALITLSLGILGTVDAAGAPVADGAYPALAVWIIAGPQQKSAHGRFGFRLRRARDFGPLRVIRTRKSLDDGVH